MFTYHIPNLCPATVLTYPCGTAVEAVE